MSGTFKPEIVLLPTNVTGNQPAITSSLARSQLKPIKIVTMASISAHNFLLTA